MTQICVGKLPIIGSDNGLSPGRRQAIIWTNAGILLIGILGTTQWNLNRNPCFHSKTVFQIFDRRLAAILPRPQCFCDKENSMALLIKSLWCGAQQIMRIDFWGPHAMVIWTILYRCLLTCYALALIRSQRKEYMGQATKLWLSCYLVLLSIDRKTR